MALMSLKKKLKSQRDFRNCGIKKFYIPPYPYVIYPCTKLHPTPMCASRHRVRNRTAKEAEKGKEHEEKFGGIVGRGVEGGEGTNKPEKSWEEVGMYIY